MPAKKEPAQPTTATEATPAEEPAPRVKGPKVEFIDASDPEWKEFIVEDKPLELDGQTFGTLREDDEGHLTLIILGGSCNFHADQRAALKKALSSSVSSWPTGSQADLGFNTTSKMGVDPDTEEPRLVIRSAGMVRLTKEQAEVVAGLL